VVKAILGFVVAVGVMALGCASSKDGDGPGGAQGPGGGQAAGSLQGTWDVVGSRLGLQNQMSFVVTLQPSSFAVVTSHGSLNALISGTGATIDVEESSPRQVVATHSGRGQLNLGALPVDISGNWMLASTPADGSSCSWSLGAGTVSGSCTDADFDLDWAPDPGTGTMTGSRTRVVQSIFGDLGGEWTVTFSEGASMTAIFEGNTLSLSGSEALGGRVSWINLSFDGNTASGTGSDSIEFSAQRR